MQALIFAGIAVWLLQTLGWLLSLVQRRMHTADTFWGPGIALVSWVALVVNAFTSPALVLVTILTTIWGLRLAISIGRRNAGKPEDRRYEHLSRDWKNKAMDSYIRIWMLQGMLMLALGAAAFSLTESGVVQFPYLAGMGALVWLFGFCWEVVADRQLAHFKANPDNKGKLMTYGLWARSRHPNYFGEVVLWWGIWLIAASAGGGLIGLMTPLAITFLILKVSGIPMLEAHYDHQDRDDWKAYKQAVPVFWPRF